MIYQPSSPSLLVPKSEVSAPTDFAPKFLPLLDTKDDGRSQLGTTTALDHYSNLASSPVTLYGNMMLADLHPAAASGMHPHNYPHAYQPHHPHHHAAHHHGHQHHAHHHHPQDQGQQQHPLDTSSVPHLPHQLPAGGTLGASQVNGPQVHHQPFQISSGVAVGPGSSDLSRVESNDVPLVSDS